MSKRYADIVLPLAQPAYCFSIPECVEVQLGDAVAVQFGVRNVYTGIVWRLHNEPPQVKRIKSIGRKLYDVPLLGAEQMRYWEWLAEYYMCTLGEVMRMALPSLIKPKGGDEVEFAKCEFSPRTEAYVALSKQWSRADVLAECERMRRRAPRRAEVLEQIVNFEGSGLNSYGEIPRRLLDCDAAQINTLRKAGYIEVNERERWSERADEIVFNLPALSPAQQRVAEEISSSQHIGRAVHLLHGVTGSGKTEIYMHFIAQTLAKGQDVLMLVPEIALTGQLIDRLQTVFGSRVTAYHSKLTALRRTESYLRLARSRGGELVVGARSALFLPLNHLGLVVVDEEHDQSYKQSDTAPRYQGRDCAVVLASLYGARVLLGSATPSLESYANAQWGKYGYSRLEERYGASKSPKIIISDTMRSVKRGERKSHFNIQLLNAMRDALGRGEQVMLFQNRRGFTPFVQCSGCGWTMRCPHCNVTLTMHRVSNRMECHYCGHVADVPRFCPQCETADLKPMGFGTERVEEAVKELFEVARVARLDRDTSTSESAYNRIVRSFEEGQTDVLVGTQMITKGFDFSRVAVVGILNADNLICSPDFRASERAFQLMTQVAGRAGRRENEGVVVIQTSEVEHPVLQWVVAGNYDAMARSELAERHAFNYPPYSRLIQFTLRCDDVQLLRRGSTWFAERLREKFGNRIFGPVSPPVDRIRGVYIMRLMLKIENGRSMSRARELVREALSLVVAHQEYKPINISIDVDAQ
ncbi:MAG: primosomal protein N' [Alistipes sp.]|nr:primosomal protein N' [Alistipes sp.]